MLEALKWGADLIVSIDDDMIPQGDWDFACRFEFPFDGLQLGAKHHWFDAGVFSTPPAPQRGLPPDVLPVSGAEHVVDARIGAAQGIIFGVPDTDAVTAMSKAPRVLGATDILRNGFVVHPAGVRGVQLAIYCVPTRARSGVRAVLQSPGAQHRHFCIDADAPHHAEPKSLHVFWSTDGFPRAHIAPAVQGSQGRDVGPGAYQPNTLTICTVRRCPMFR